MSKELSASAKSLRKSRECFIEVYIDNRWIIFIIYYSLSNITFFSRGLCLRLRFRIGRQQRMVSWPSSSLKCQLIWTKTSRATIIWRRVKLKNFWSNFFFNFGWNFSKFDVMKALLPQMERLVYSLGLLL